MSTRINRATQFITRARNAYGRYRPDRVNYEEVADLIVKHAERIAALSPSIIDDDARQEALAQVYSFLGRLQERDSEVQPSEVGPLLMPIGEGCYVTLPARAEY